MDKFFHFDLGNLSTIIVILGSLIKMHTQNLATLKANVAQTTKMEMKVELMWRAFKQKFNIHDSDVE